MHIADDQRQGQQCLHNNKHTVSSTKTFRNFTDRELGKRKGVSSGDMRGGGKRAWFSLRNCVKQGAGSNKIPVNAVKHLRFI